jgi:hypothetical protein
MSSALLDERSVVVQPSLVRATGSVTRAAIVQQIAWHLIAPKDADVREHDGHRWLVMPFAELGDEIGLTEEKVRRGVGWLREPFTTEKIDGKRERIVLDVEPFIIGHQAASHDRTMWLRLNTDHPLLPDLSKRRTRRLETANAPLANGERAACSSTDLEEETEREPRKRGSLPPDDFAADATHQAIADERGLKLDHERLAWIDYSKAHGKRYVDHAAAFRKWLRDAHPQQPTGPSFVPGDPGSRYGERPTCSIDLCDGSGNVLGTFGDYLGRCACVPEGWLTELPVQASV